MALEADLRTTVDAFLKIFVIGLGVLDQASHMVVPLPQFDFVSYQAVLAALCLPQKRRILHRVLLNDASEIVIVGDDHSFPELLGHWYPCRKVFF